MEPDVIASDEELMSVEDLLDTGRMREELAIARRIQRAFLPEAPPGLQGFEIDGWNEPCRETGGDYYDYVRLPGGRLGLAIGDVSGHGIGPALLMANARAALRALLQVAESPGDVLGRLNDLLVADTLDGKGMPLGIAQGQRYAEGDCVTLKHGDLLACFTDGLWEATDLNGEMFGHERLRAALLRTRGGSASEIAADLRREAFGFAGGAHQSDDLTLMALKVL